VTVAVPGACPVTSPVDDTIAMFAWSTVQFTGAPEITAPFASFTVAVSCDVCPVLMGTDVGATVMLAATAAETAIPDVPVFPSLVAVIVVAPMATPVTSPVASTVATASFADDHVTVRPTSGFPAASSGCAWRCTVTPTWIAALGGLTVTDATLGGITVMVEKPEFPLTLAAIRTTPTAMPVTTPALDTVATCAFSVFQNTLEPDTVLPFTFAVSVALAPSAMESVGGETVTLPLPPPGPVESPPPHDRMTAAHASAEMNGLKIDLRAARIDHSLCGEDPTLSRARTTACTRDVGGYIIMNQPRERKPAV